MRWRRAFPGAQEQIGEARRFVKTLLASSPLLDDLILITSELTSNAICHTASGRGGVFVVEVTQLPLGKDGFRARIAVLDGGAPTDPIVRCRDENAPGGRGLALVAALAVRRGIDGDQTGRVVWAELDWHAPASQQFMDGSPLVPQTSVAAAQAEMNARYTDWLIWFGPWSGFWYGVPKDTGVPALMLVAVSAQALADDIDAAFN
ncbi:ATP-binding protein [Streptosporangium sp. NBC_01755]|uniref:ATP-binding protein n=1 Tax=Streptosporangium sp. NBC_01755 TaxID=2975949 RepID=UPI002DD81DCD|nr:ATP-binding protein [Streptosporangium sp. NBC_01755]WSC97581.1 ATP-binding protein [Streptosporangium sp. NBC_01755]